MSLGKKLISLRKKSGLSQEEAAEKLEVSRQTIGKWENETATPDLENTKRICKLYNVSYDFIVGESPLIGDLTSVELIVDQVDWTKAWSEKYPILLKYRSLKGIEKYIEDFEKTYASFRADYPEVSQTDVFLILKDILYQKYRTEKKKN